MAESLAATMMFLYIEGVNGGMIQGEARDSAHLNEVQLQSFEFHASGDKSGGDGSWRPDFTPISLTVATGKASPYLFRAVCAGTVFKRVIISCRKHGAGKVAGDYLQWMFKDVQVIDYNMKISDDKPEETIKISYQGVEMYYARQDQDGSLKDPIKKAWSLNDNKDAATTLPFTPKAAPAS